MKNISTAISPSKDWARGLTRRKMVSAPLMLRSLIWLVFICLIISGAAVGQEPGPDRPQFHVVLSGRQKAHILDGEFSIVVAVEKFPKAVRAVLAEIFRQNTFEIANPGQRYQSTDVGENGPLRRLVFAGVSSDKCFVYYERGGRGHGYYVVVLRIDAEKRARFLWAGAGADDALAHDLQQLRAKVSAGRFKDNALYSW